MSGVKIYETRMVCATAASVCSPVSDISTI
jgi:hypothetical protein